MKANFSNFAWVAALTIATMTVSCSNENEPVINPNPNNTPEPQEEQALTFSTNVLSPAETRAYEASWEADDRVGIFMVNSADTTAIKSNAQHVATNVSGWKLNPVSDSDGMYYPSTGADVKFIAYYPYKNGQSLTNLLSVELGEQSATSNDFDILYVKATSSYNKSSGTTPALNFKHIMATMIVNVKKDDAISNIDLSTMSVTLKGAPTKGTFNLQDGTFVATNTVAPINFVKLSTPTSGFDATYQAIILPHTGTQYSGRQLEFDYEDENGVATTKVYEMASLENFSGETEQPYNWTMSTDEVTIGTVSITDWETANSIVIED
ncbi:MAG: fimbrillin family protein [Prevotellaceae bacterium]|jgi:hypothetical protein|nr:fimbrillin family protein [Prevotellaceae bacterium]